MNWLVGVLLILCAPALAGAPMTAQRFPGDGCAVPAAGWTGCAHEGDPRGSLTLLAQRADGPCYGADFMGPLACFGNGAYVQTVDRQRSSGRRV